MRKKRIESTSGGFDTYWPSPEGACPTEGRVYARFPYAGIKAGYVPISMGTYRTGGMRHLPYGQAANRIQHTYDVLCCKD